MSDDYDIAVRYLRGELGDDETLAFEERIIADEALHALVEAAEDELLDAYLDDQLPHAVGDRLRHRLAVEPRLRERLVLVAALRERARDAALRSAPRSAHRRWWWFVAPITVAAAVAGVLIVTAPLPAPRDPIVVSLALQTPTRASSVPEISLTREISRLRLSLDGAPATAGAVAVRGPKGPVPATLRTDASGLTVEIEATELHAGLYDLVLSTAGAPPVLYQLRVIRP